MGDYLGMPINAAALFRAESWSATLVELPENQCRAARVRLRLARPVEPEHLEGSRSGDAESDRVSHPPFGVQRGANGVDGRAPHPPEYARHTWAGFSTGTWEGDTLVIYTTHLKENWLGLNGLPRSDMATATVHIMRHGNVLTVAAITYDPVYLTEPLIRTIDFTFAPQQQMAPWPCESVDEVDRPEGRCRAT